MSDIKKKLKAMQQGNKQGMKAMMIQTKLMKLFHLDREGREERYGLHASNILASENEFCLREMVLSLFYKQNNGRELPTASLAIFKNGESVHEKWQKMFVKMGIACTIEKTRFVEKFDLSFTPDATINILGEEDVPVEIKSMNTFQFKKANSHPSGEKQLNFYLWLLKKEWGFVLCEDKNDQQIKVFPVYFDKEKVRPYYQRLKLIQEAKQEFLEEGTLPKRKCKSCEVKRASECNMRDACYKIGMGRVKLNVKVRNDGEPI
jgi:CRISPR/Cas system-associated exonuclease Cas4 (RecB family)